MAALEHAQDRLAFAAEGVSLWASDVIDTAREHLVAVIALGAAVATAIVLALSLGGESGTPAGTASGPAPAPSGAALGYVGERSFSVSMPNGWERSDPPPGAAFAAVSTGGLAEATLWIERAPGLPFESFVDQSMTNLDEIADDVRVGERLGGPDLASRTVTLLAEVPLDGGHAAAYRVTLRASGPNRYYLATVTQPGADAGEIAGTEVLSSTFRPATRPSASATTAGRP